MTLTDVEALIAQATADMRTAMSPTQVAAFRRMYRQLAALVGADEAERAIRRIGQAYVDELVDQAVRV